MRLCLKFAIISALCAASAFGRVIEVDIDGIVHPITVSVVASAIAQAQREHADALLIRLSTPGGFMDAMRDIIEEIFHSPVPVITWVGPAGARAASAGFFLLESGDVAAMAPGTNTGASHPVLADGGQMDAVMNTKVENDAAALMRTIATHRGRNVQEAEKAVRQSVSWTEQEALNDHLIDLIAPDPGTLLRDLNGRRITRFDGAMQTLHFNDTQVDVYGPSLRQRILIAIADPNIALILVVLGALGIYAKFAMPGMFAPGVIGAILVLLGLTALSMLPINWLGAGLMILGLIFFVIEAKYPTHGILAVGGAVGLALGAVMLVDTNVPGMRVRWSTAVGIALPFALITSFLLTIVLRARRNKVVTGAEGMVGQTGVAVGELNPSGTVLVRGEYWHAQASARVPASEPVRITGIDGLTLRVESAPHKET